MARILLICTLVLALLAGCIGGRQQPSRPPMPSQTARPSTAEQAAEARQCQAALQTARASFAPLANRELQVGCPLMNTVALFSAPGDRQPIAMTNLGLVHCQVARRVVAWARYGAARAALQVLGSEVVRVETMGSYNCRRVAGRPDRMSAHATAAAADVSGFVLADGRRITVREHWNGPDPEARRFLRIVHASACKRFGTVLGPDYNAAHYDHLHMELGDGSFCR